MLSDDNLLSHLLSDLLYVFMHRGQAGTGTTTGVPDLGLVLGLVQGLGLTLALAVAVALGVAGP